MGVGTPNISIIVHCLGTGCWPIAAELVKALDEEAIEARISKSGGSGGNGCRGDCGSVVLFDEVCDELIAWLHESTGEGLRRVLAVAIDAAVISGGKAWTLLRAAAADVIACTSVSQTAGIIAAKFGRWAEVDRLVDSPLVRNSLVGRSRAWTLVLREVAEIASFSSSSVLLTGETGTGKELVANLMHELDRRPDKGAMAVLDCTTIVPELSGSEFFGHERGAFTTAVSSREGAFALADGGTLFLDEVGELPLTLQAALLRVIQERLYKAVGSNTWKRVQFRLICATNRDLLQEEARGAMRRDFYFRIAAASCRLPSLAQRREDILPLVAHFLRGLNFQGPVDELDPAVRDYLLLRDYPGNVRELRQLVTRMAGRHVGPGPLSVGDIPQDERPKAGELLDGDWRRHLKPGIRYALAHGISLREIGSGASQTAIETAMEDEAGNLQRAARRLGVTDRALQMRRAADRVEDRRVDPLVDAAKQVGSEASHGGRN